MLNRYSRIPVWAMLCFYGLSVSCFADDEASGVRADSHAPIGVMADHLHKKGEWMLSYQFMRMSMESSRIGSERVTAEDIATSVANPFAGLPMQPPTLRVVPTSMTTDMHMFGGMYAPTDWVTLMVMTSVLEREMDHVTFAGPTGTNIRGGFTTRSSGFGDTSVSGLFRLLDNGRHKAHAQVGVSLPTGSITEEDQVLAPTGATPTLRLPYPMQLGSGSFDPILGVTYTGFSDYWSWGAQYTTMLRVEDNNQGYRRGDEHKATTWLSRLWTPNISTSIRIAAMDRGNVDGFDSFIVAPVQTADPNNQGGQRLDLGLGVNLLGTGVLSGHRVALEFSFPLAQDLDGPQLESDWVLHTGYQYSF